MAVAACENPLLRPLSLGLALALLAGCGGDRSDRLDATPDDVDESSSVTITDAELAAFREPSDGRLSEAQVEQFLKTSLLQFDLVRKHGERLHSRYQEMEAREEKGGGLMAGLRNLVDAGRTLYEVGDLLGGSYIRSARTLGYNPAEMEWVRSQMVEVSTYLAMKPMYEAAAQGARDMRAQSEELRRRLAESGATSGFSESDLDNMMSMASEMESSADGHEVSEAVLANSRVLRSARPAVTDPMWVAVGISSGASGLLALSGLGDPQDAEAQAKLDEFRQLFTDALENRVTPGMERSAGSE